MDKHVSAGENLKMGNKRFPPPLPLEKLKEAEYQQILPLLLAKAGREGDPAKANLLSPRLFLASYLHYCSKT